MASELTSGPILFFDGTCGLCDRSMRWLLKRDVHGVLRFAPLQGTTASKLLGSGARQSATVVLWSHGKTWHRSEAVLKALAMLGGWPGVLARVGAWIPMRLRDLVYDGVARNRKKWFGETACTIPPNTTQLLP